MRNWIQELHTAALHSMRLLLWRKETRVVFCFGLVLMSALLFFLNEAKEEKSVVYIGLSDEDRTEKSAALAERIRKLPVFHVTEDSTKELLPLLKKGNLAAVFVIREGYEEKVSRGAEEKLLLVYEPETGKFPLLSDIVAGEMMYDICTAKGWKIYEELAGAREDVTLLPDKNAYVTYVNSYLDDETFDFSFKTEYIDREGETGAVLENSVIYVQVIFSVLAMITGFLAVYAVMPYVELCHGKTAKRLRVLPIGKWSVAAGCGLSAFFVVAFFAALCVFVFAARNGLSAETFFCMLFATAGYSAFIVAVTLLLAGILPGAAVYQLTMLLLVVFCGTAGFLSVAEGLIGQGDILQLAPNSHYVKTMIHFYTNR